MRPFEDAEWVAGPLAISTEHQLAEVLARSGDFHELAE